VIERDEPEEGTELGDLPGDEPVELSNEYATVRVRRVFTRNGVRLEIVAPHFGRGIRLDPLELETLTWQSHELFSSFLRTPFGPEGDVERAAQ
jgi:hypothetical protein